MLEELWEKIRSLTTGEKKAYPSDEGLQLRKSVVWLMAYVQRPLYDITLDIIKLSFAVSMAYLVIRIAINCIVKLWR